jgi:transcriptional regulator with XRE-family HTH domain
MGQKRRKRTRLSDQLRRIVEESDVTRYRLSKETGITQSTLSRFVSGERGLSIEAMDALGEFFQLEFVSRRPNDNARCRQV